MVVLAATLLIAAFPSPSVAQEPDVVIGLKPKVRVYKHKDFKGWVREIPADTSATLPQNARASISSVEIPDGYWVTFFDQPDRKGNRLHLQGPGRIERLSKVPRKDSRSFPIGHWNDQIWSMQITKKRPETEGVICTKASSVSGDLKCPPRPRSGGGGGGGGIVNPTLRKRTICSGQENPTGWVTVDFTRTNDCNTNIMGNNTVVIADIRGVEKGRVEVCYTQQPPEGWKIVARRRDVVTCVTHMPFEGDNIRVIERIF